MIGTALRRTGAGAPPTFVAGYSDGINNSSHTLNVPTGTADGDLMIVAIGSASYNPPTSVPAGWTLVQSSTAFAQPTLFVYSRVASSEPASYSWSTGANSRAVVATYRGTSGVDASSIYQQGSASPVAHSVTTTVPNTRLLYILRFDAAAAWTPAAGFAVDVQSPTSGNTPNGIWSATRAAAGATGDVTFTQGGASQGFAAALVALKP